MERLVRRACPRAHAILDLGCGTGVHATLLAAKGFRIHGVDLSETMLARAEGRRLAAAPEIATRLSFAAGDVRSYRIDERFDAVASLFHVASYQIGDADFGEFVSTAACHLKDGGAFVFDFWYGPAVLTDRPAVRVKRLEDEAIRVVRIAEPVIRPNENRVDVNYQITITEKATGEVEEVSEIHAMRYFFLPEVNRLLAEQGFSSWRAEEWMTGKLPGIDTWGVCVTAYK